MCMNDEGGKGTTVEQLNWQVVDDKALEMQ